MDISLTGTGKRKASHIGGSGMSSEILYLLRENSVMSFGELAMEMRSSRDRVQTAVRDLMEKRYVQAATS